MKNKYQAIKWIGVLFLGTLLLGFGSLQAYKAYLKNATKIQTSNGISSLEALELGGVNQSQVTYHRPISNFLIGSLAKV